MAAISSARCAMKIAWSGGRRKAGGNKWTSEKQSVSFWLTI